MAQALYSLGQRRSGLRSRPAKLADHNKLQAFKDFYFTKQNLTLPDITINVFYLLNIYHILRQL